MSMLTAVRETLTGFKSLLIGMRITGREAVRPIKTVQYPRETLPMPARFRGHIQLTLDPETGRPRCTACTLCAKACPSGCIDLDGLKREGDKKKSVSKYMLDFSKCSLCGSCVEICPSDAIEFSKQYNVVSFTRSTFDTMDLYADIEHKSAEWTKAHPLPAAAATPPMPVSPVAPDPQPGPGSRIPAAPAATTKNVAGLAEPGQPGSATPATGNPTTISVPHHVNGSSVHPTVAGPGAPGVQSRPGSTPAAPRVPAQTGERATPATPQTPTA